MTPHPRLSRAGIELVKRFEGLRHKAARLEQGGWTIGYGHTASAREGVEITADQAEGLLIYDLDRVAHAIDPLIFTALNSNQFNALIAFTFNVGVDQFVGSAVLKRVNEGAALQAAAAIELWRRSDFRGDSMVVDGLVRRRAAEKLLFLTPTDGFRAVPTPVVRPTYDGSAADLRNQARGLAGAAELHVPLDGELAVAARGGEVEEAARNVAARLQQLFPEAEAPPAEPAAPPFPTTESAPEAPPAPEPFSEPAPESSPEPESVLEPEPPPLPGPEPFAPVPPWPADPAAPKAPLAEAAAPAPLVFEPAPRRPAPDRGQPAGELLPVDFGQRERVKPKSAPTPPPAASSRVLVVGAVGALMFIGALLAMVYGKATLVNLAIGLVGVLCMVPAGLQLLLGLFGERPADDR